MGQDGYRWPNGRVCPGHPVRVEVLDDLVWEHTRELIEEPALVLAEYTKRLNGKKNRKLSLDALLAKKTKERKQQDVEKQRLLDLYQAGDIALEEIKERLKSIRTRIKKIEGERALLEQEDKTQQHSLQLIEQFESFKKRITKNLATLNFAEKKEVVRLLVKDVIVDTTTEEMVINHIVPIEKSSPLCPGRDHATLRHTSLGGMKHLILDIAGFEPLFDQLPCGKIANGL
jgi:hypothetical protein